MKKHTSVEIMFLKIVMLHLHFSALRSKFLDKNSNVFYVPSGYEEKIEPLNHDKFRILYTGSLKEIQNLKIFG